jgi:Alg9-like mannosyltransferase family
LKQINWTSYKTILIAALIIRIIAAIFSQGYGMHDDHFLIVEAAASWVDGYDYNHWLPWTPESTGKPEGHSFTYVGLNFFYFYIMKFLGVADPKILMLINRLLHALFSMLVVYFGIKITEKISAPESGKKNAVIVGWILALLWMMPFLSVRNLVEMTCIPFILWSVWLMVKNEKRRNFLFAGLLMGMAISFRYQVGVFAVGFAAVYFFQFKWARFILFSTGVLLVFALTQGLVDYLIWGYPFAEFLGYFTYNSNEGTAYIPNQNYFMYLLVLMGSCLFPLGLLLGAGFFVSLKKYAFLFVPVILFIIFHSLYPSKQERFIFPVLPLFIMLGVIGYDMLAKSALRQKIWKYSYRFFWILNIPLLLVVSVAYSKQSRVEAMYYFYETNQKPQKILMEATGETGLSMAPKFYAGSWRYGMLEHTEVNQDLNVFPNYRYDYILFFGEKDLDKRIAQYKVLYPKMELGKKCEPSFVDRFLRWLNPRNTNEYIEVWKTHAIPA